MSRFSGSIRWPFVLLVIITTGAMLFVWQPQAARAQCDPAAGQPCAPSGGKGKKATRTPLPTPRPTSTATATITPTASATATEAAAPTATETAGLLPVQPVPPAGPQPQPANSCVLCGPSLPWLFGGGLFLLIALIGLLLFLRRPLSLVPAIQNSGSGGKENATLGRGGMENFTVSWHDAGLETGTLTVHDAGLQNGTVTFQDRGTLENATLDRGGFESNTIGGKDIGESSGGG